MVRQQESEWGCYDQRKDTAHKHNSTKLMAAKRKTRRFNFTIFKSRDTEYMLIYAAGDHADDHGEAHGKGRAK